MLQGSRCTRASKAGRRLKARKSTSSASRQEEKTRTVCSVNEQQDDRSPAGDGQNRTVRGDLLALGLLDIAVREVDRAVERRRNDCMQGMVLATFVKKKSPSVPTDGKDRNGQKRDVQLGRTNTISLLMKAETASQETHSCARTGQPHFRSRYPSCTNLRQGDNYSISTQAWQLGRP